MPPIGTNFTSKMDFMQKLPLLNVYTSVFTSLFSVKFAIKHASGIYHLYPIKTMHMFDFHVRYMEYFT